MFKKSKARWLPTNRNPSIHSWEACDVSGIRFFYNDNVKNKANTDIDIVYRCLISQFMNTDTAEQLNSGDNRISIQQQNHDISATRVDMKLEVEIIPVSDVERSKRFYQSLGWRFDDDVSPVDGVRIVQFTPPGSACSVTFGKGITAAAPGSAEGALIVSDIEVAHDDLIGRGIEASNVWHGPPFPREARQPGPDPKRTSYGSFSSFNDPDGNTWLVQEVTTRAPGRA